MTPTPDDFEIWSVHPVTQYVMKAITAVRDEAQRNWSDAAWAGNLKPEYHAETRGRCSAYDAILGMTIEGVQEMNGDSTEDADETE
jgi:hypothetical protein